MAATRRESGGARYNGVMTPTLILDTSVLIAGLRSSLGASFALLISASQEFSKGLTGFLEHFSAAEFYRLGEMPATI